jgi:hypothetical protein
MSFGKLNFRPLASAIKDICTPFGLELLLCTVLALLFYGVLVYKRFFAVLSGSGQPLPPDYFHNLTDNLASTLNHLPFAGNLVSPLIWSVLGVSLYVLIILIINVFITLQNAITALNTNKSAPSKIVSIGYEIRRSFWILVALIYFYSYIKLLYLLLLQFGATLDAGWWLCVVAGVIVLSIANYLFYVFINLVRASPALVNLDR